MVIPPVLFLLNMKTKKLNVEYLCDDLMKVKALLSPTRTRVTQNEYDAMKTHYPFVVLVMRGQQQMMELGLRWFYIDTFHGYAIRSA